MAVDFGGALAPVPVGPLVPEIPAQNIPLPPVADPFAAVAPTVDPYSPVNAYAPATDAAFVDPPAPAAPIDIAALVPEIAATPPLTDFLSPSPEVTSAAPEPVSTDGGSLNWFMIIVVAVVAVLTIIFSLYIMVIYQHPEDKNQAWFPKIIVIFGMTLAIYTVLMFPLDVTNSQVCDLNLPLVDCSTTFPMDILWQVVYIANMVTVFVLVPFAFFYYEGDSEWYGVIDAYYILNDVSRLQNIDMGF